MKVVRTSDMPWADALKKGAYSQRRKELGGGERLMASLYELAPGKKSFPFHAHMVTEEALFVISGKAKVRTPEGLTPIGAGDFVSFPAGGPAHQLINDGSEPLVYVGVSATQGVDVVEYPDSNKIASAVGKFPTGKRFIFKKSDMADYFADDKDAE
ncbi:MAG: cupin domain-containing protein [Myxococcaceae bacterium]